MGSSRDPTTDERTLAEVLVERSPNGVLVTGPDGLLRMVNPAVRRIVPVVPDPLGRTPLLAVPIPSIADALAPDREDDLEFALSSGNRDLLVRVTSLPPSGSRLAIIHDVTRLRQAERIRSDFVANVSHELRTPATSIAGYAETLLEELRDSAADPSHVAMVEVIQRNARRLTDLFDDLLHLSRIEAREGPMEVEDLVLAQVVAEATDKHRAPADAKEITLQTFVPDGLLCRANREALGHVVGNLVDNAIKYSHPRGVVTVRARQKEGRVLVEVIDVGIGIDPAHHDRIFERFYRVDKGRSRDVGGTGLGLAIVKHLCRAMDADISVRSRPGRGSVFRVSLPKS